MIKWIIFAVTIIATVTYMSLTGLSNDPRMLFIGLYGFGVTLFGYLYGAESRK